MRRLLAALGFMVFGVIAPGLIAPVSPAFAQEFELPALYGPQGALFPPAATAGRGGFYVGGPVGYSAAGAHFAPRALYAPQGALPPPAATAGWGGFYVGGQVGYSAAGANFANAVNDLSSFIVRDSVFEPIVGGFTHLGRAG